MRVEDFPLIAPLGSSVVELIPNGPIFKDHRVSSVTAFNLCDRFSRGENILPFLNEYYLSNRVRTFCYVPVKDWGVNAWSFPTKETVKSYIEFLAENGKALSLTLLTDNNEKMIPLAKDLVSYLNNFSPPGLILEAVNEPLTHDKINPNELKSVLSGSRHMYTSGIYEDLRKFWGECGCYHSPRDNEWPRKAKDTIECYNGGGPNFPDEPPCKVPWILDEPIRPDQANGNVVLDFYTYGCLGSLTSAGITFHCETAKLTNLPTEFEYQCYQALTSGMNIFPVDAPLGKYDHRRDLEKIDPITNEPTACLRVFQVGKYAVIVRNKNVDIPSNWKYLDTVNVAFEIL